MKCVGDLQLAHGVLLRGVASVRSTWETTVLTQARRGRRATCCRSSPTTPERECDPAPIVNTTATEHEARFSPDGTWIAYRSNRTVRHGIYIQPRSSGPPVLMSENGRLGPFWRHDGRELFYVSTDKSLMSVEVPARSNIEMQAGFRPAPPRRLFGLPANCAGVRCLEAAAITREGRFLIVTRDYAPEAPIRVHTSWTSTVNRSATGR